MTTDARKTPEERKEALAQQVANQAAMGRRVESQSDFQAIMVAGKPPNHILHLILTLCTVGVWGIIWLALALLGGEKKELVRVDEFGNVSVAKL